MPAFLCYNVNYITIYPLSTALTLEWTAMLPFMCGGMSKWISICSCVHVFVMFPCSHDTVYNFPQILSKEKRGCGQGGRLLPLPPPLPPPPTPLSPSSFFGAARNIFPLFPPSPFFSPSLLPPPLLPPPSPSSPSSYPLFPLLPPPHLPLISHPLRNPIGFLSRSLRSSPIVAFLP